MQAKQTNVRLDPETLSLLKRIKSRMGISVTDVLRLGIRLLARQELPEKYGKSTSQAFEE